MQIETVTPMFFDADALREPNYRLYRIYTPKGRFYYTYDEGDVSLYIGVTTFLGRLLPKSEQLVKWVAGMGYEAAEKYKIMKASYGTLMHNEFAKFMINKEYDLDSLFHIVEEYCNKEGYAEYIDEWHADLTNDMLSFCQFTHDYNIKPIAIEIALCHPSGFSGTIDLICKMDIDEEGYYGEVYKSGDKKGEPKLTKQKKTVIAAVDFKSGRKGLNHESYDIQLESYKHLIEVNFPDIEVEKLYNFAPKEWVKSPTYSLSDKTDSVDRQKFDLLLELAKIEMMKMPVYTKVTGKIKMGEPSPENVVVQENVIDYIRDKHIMRNFESNEA